MSLQDLQELVVRFPLEFVVIFGVIVMLVLVFATDDDDLGLYERSHETKS